MSFGRTAAWRNLLAGFWFIPGLVALGYVALAVALTETERRSGARGFGVAFAGDASAARQLLGVVAGSITTLAGLTFSITIVALQLVSSQFSPRALRNFLADRLNQVVAGSFVGIVVYCLLVLRVVHGDGGASGFVPTFSVAVALALGVVGLGLLLVFISHMAWSIQLSAIAARIGRDTLASVERIYPQRFGADASDEAAPQFVKPAIVRASRPGWVQVVNLDKVAAALAGRAARVHVPVCPGDFVTEEDAIARVVPASAVDEGVRDALARAVHVESERDLIQDAAYGIRQLADIALRAISPAVNDATTAVTCIGYLRSILERIACRDLPGTRRSIAGLTVTARRRTFREYV